ncbi:DNA repair protein RAD51 homolog 4 isoform X3 [Marmota flaviventris]|uniref:DNA repair protein RAD51 homolog 4 isoform X3 n=1 Tax=Marmota flaviventris TaxID=93162 RepID=UPI003A871983
MRSGVWRGSRSTHVTTSAGARRTVPGLRGHGRAQSWTVPGPHPGDGPASEEPRHEDRPPETACAEAECTAESQRRETNGGKPGLPGRQSPARVLFLVVDLAAADLEEVAQKCGLSYKALVALRRVLLAQFSAFPSNGADLYEEMKTSTAILSTGIGSLDKLLDAGLYTGEVTEIVGGPGSGKTQVCLCVAANVAHGLQQNVLYIDSNGGLTASRLLQLLQPRTQDEEEQARALQRIQVVHAFDIFQMLDVLQDLRGTVTQQVRCSSGTVKVVIVDSVTAVVSPLLGGQQRDGLALMMQLARELKTLARELSMAVVPTGFQEVVDIGTWETPEQSPVFRGEQT